MHVPKKAAWIIAVILAHSCTTARFSSQDRVKAVTYTKHTKKFSAKGEGYSASFEYDQRATPETDRFPAGERGKLDIMIVVDNSNSMTDEHQNLGSKLRRLLEHVSDTDWKIAINTTTPRDGCIVNILQRGTMDVESKFYQGIINVGTLGDSVERGLYQAVEGLKGDCTLQKEWLRKGSTVAVLIVSDEDNCHDFKNYDFAVCNAGDAKASYLVNYLKSIRTIRTQARVYGLYVMPGDANCDTGLKEAAIYAEAVRATGGTAGSICDRDYSGTLSRISKDVAGMMPDGYLLRFPPIPGSANVRINGNVTMDFSLINRKLTIAKRLNPSDVIEVSYLVRDGSQATYEFTPSPKPFSIESVAIDGTVVGDGEYSFAPERGSVQLAQAPGHGQTVRIKYTGPKRAATSLTMPAELEAGRIKVFVAGKVTTGFRYDIKGAIVLDENPAPGTEIRVDYEVKDP